MLHLFPLRDDKTERFKTLFAAYYRELGCDDDTEELVREYVIPDILAGLIKVELLEDGGEAAGFIIYQRDEIDNDWNFKEGMGDVREIYVIPPLRRKGLGKFMLYAAEMKLKEAGVTSSYCLPCKNAEKFFEACGYEKSEDFNEDLDCFAFVKEPINLHECGK